MKKKFTLEHLEKEVWWWRPGAKNHEFFNPENSLAFNYELARRAYRKERFPAFPAVAGLCRFAVPQLDETPVQEQACRFSTGTTSEKGWTLLPAFQWNLSVADPDLATEFLRLVQQARESQNVDAKPPQRKRTRPLSWTWLELMDIDEFKIRRLADNERSKLSAAWKVAAKKATIFDAAIEEFRAWQLSEAKARSPFFPEGFAPPPVKTPLKSWRDVWPTERRNR